VCVCVCVCGSGVGGGGAGAHTGESLMLVPSLLCSMEGLLKKRTVVCYR
jgi:hypothetical protein